MTSQILHIPLEPIGKGRPRARAIKVGGRWKAAIHTDAQTRKWERQCAVLAKAQWRGEPLSGPVRVIVNACHKRPKNRPRFVPVDAWATGEAVYRPCKPDASNILKIVEDALNGICWHDDAQIVDAWVCSMYCAVDMEPEVQVIVAEAGWLR